MYSDQPPPYSEVHNQHQIIQPTAPDISDHTQATPSQQSNYPQQQNYPPLPPVHSDDKQQVPYDKPVSPNQNSYGTIDQHTISVPTEIMVIGGCPVCRIGVLEDDFTCLGVCLAIFCFPIGILCCIALKNKRCSNCGAQY